MHAVKTGIALSLVFSVTLAFGCGGSKEGEKNKDEQKGTAKTTEKPGDSPKKGDTAEAVAPEVTTRPMGADKIKAFNYVYGKGNKFYKKVAKAAKKEDWAAVKEACEAALEADPWHLAAHRSLAGTLARLGETAGIKDHLSTALAGDWLRWGPTLETDPTLAEYFKTDDGKEVLALNRAYQEEFMRRAKAGIWMLGRRTRYKRPEKPGEQWSATRAELFSYDEETKRYLRISHTGESLAGWMVSPSGSEIVLAAYSLVHMPAPSAPEVAASAGGVEAVKPLIDRVRISVLSNETLLPVTPEESVRLRGGFTRVDLQYRAGDELIASVFDGAAEWDYKADTEDEPSQRYTLDKEAGKFRKADVPASDETVLSMTLEKTWMTARTGGKGYELKPGEGDPVLVLDGAEGEATLPAEAQVMGVVRSPDKAHAVVRTVVDPCAEKPLGSIYLMNAASGELKHILRGNSEFKARWLDDKRFVFEDDSGDLRLYDAVEKKQIDQLKNRSGMALAGIGATGGLLCTEQP